jgi:hypothetical protein
MAWESDRALFRHKAESLLNCSARLNFCKCVAVAILNLIGWDTNMQHNPSLNIIFYFGKLFFIASATSGISFFAPPPKRVR